MKTGKKRSGSPRERRGPRCVEDMVFGLLLRFCGEAVLLGVAVYLLTGLLPERPKAKGTRYERGRT